MGNELFGGAASFVQMLEYEAHLGVTGPEDQHLFPITSGAFEVAHHVAGGERSLLEQFDALAVIACCADRTVVEREELRPALFVAQRELDTLERPAPVGASSSTRWSAAVRVSEGTLYSSAKARSLRPTSCCDLGERFAIECLPVGANCHLRLAFRIGQVPPRFARGPRLRETPRPRARQSRKWHARPKARAAVRTIVDERP